MQSSSTLPFNRRIPTLDGARSRGIYVQFYDPDGRKMARSRARFERIQRRRRRMRDAVAGAPEQEIGTDAAVAMQEPPSREVASEP